MTPSFAIVRLEAIRTWRDPVMWIMLILFALLAGYAALSGAQWADARATAVQQAMAEAGETMAQRRETFAKMVAKGEKPNFGLIYATALPFRAGLPTTPLAALSAGQAEGYPAAASIAPFLDPWSIFDAHMAGLESPSVLAAGRFDLAFVIVVLLPLLLITATYDFWSRDVENGSARFQLAQPVQPAQLVLTRAAMRGGSLLAASALIACVALAIVGAHDAAGLTGFAAIVLAYGLFWIALAILINLFVRASTTAALTTGTTWLVVVVLLPGTIAAAADLAAPRPSELSYTNAIRAAGLEVRAGHSSAALAAAKAEPRNHYPASLWHSRREIQARDARLLPLHRTQDEQAARHRHIADRLRFLSPAIVVQDALDRLAGNDATRALAFQQQARGFAGRARQLAFDWMDGGRLMTLADYDRPLLRFAFTAPSRSGPIAIDLAALLLFTALLLLFAARRLRGGPAKLL
jgi:ABC-2 type transport system permease protein